MRDLIIKYLDGWNDSTSAAVSRNNLRLLLGWKLGEDNEKTLGVMLVEQIENGHFNPVSETEPALALPRPKSSSTAIERIMLDVVEGRKATQHIAKALLASGWDFKDSRGLMQKTPEEVVTFLEDVSRDIELMSDMGPSRRKYLQMICDAYRHSH